MGLGNKKAGTVDVLPTKAPAEAYTFNYAVNSTSVKIQNQYSETIDHWSPIALWEITINYVII